LHRIIEITLKQTVFRSFDWMFLQRVTICFVCPMLHTSTALNSAKVSSLLLYQHLADYSISALHVLKLQIMRKRHSIQTR